ncbi:unnamed protein product [Protopolystoma xenopodis]|uniref:Uncharacterized protein n=1 Tax=Protopolystoma xenopodis TaxID=117903 RepID=A0A3S5B412_9PLAT|nr:unnamed protein product [Protopolystoma xenopodis]
MKFVFVEAVRVRRPVGLRLKPNGVQTEHWRSYSRSHRTSRLLHCRKVAVTQVLSSRPTPSALLQTTADTSKSTLTTTFHALTPPTAWRFLAGGLNQTDL